MLVQNVQELTRTHQALDLQLERKEEEMVSIMNDIFKNFELQTEFYLEP